MYNERLYYFIKGNDMTNKFANTGETLNAFSIIPGDPLEAVKWEDVEQAARLGIQQIGMRFNVFDNGGRTYLCVCTNIEPYYNVVQGAVMNKI